MPPELKHGDLKVDGTHRSRWDASLDNPSDKGWIREAEFIAKYPNFKLNGDGGSATPSSGRTKPSWWSGDVEAIGGYDWDYLNSDNVTTANYRAFITSIQDEMRRADYKLIKISDGIFAYEPVTDDERIGREWTGDGAKAAAETAAADISKTFPDEPPWKAIPLGDEVYGIKQMKAAPTEQKWENEADANEALDMLPEKERALHIASYDANTNEWKLEKVATYDSLENITKFLGDDFTGDPDGTGRYTPRQKSIASGAPTIGAMRQALINAGLDPLEHEIYEDYSAPTNQIYKVRALSPSTGRRFVSFAEAEATLPVGFEVQGYIYEGNQYYKHVRSAIPEDEDIDKIENFDDLVYAVALTQGGAAALSVDAFRDRVNRPQMSFGAAAQIALQYGKNQTQIKNILTLLLEPPEAFDSTAFDQVMAQAGSALAGTSWASATDVANQFETGGAGSGAGVAWDIAAPVSDYQQPQVSAGRHVPSNQAEADAMVKGGNDWWNFKERDQTWLAEQANNQDSQYPEWDSTKGEAPKGYDELRELYTGNWEEKIVTTPDGNQYKNIGGTDDAGNPIIKWEKVKIAQPEPSDSFTSAVQVDPVSLNNGSNGDSKIGSFAALFEGDKHKDTIEKIKPRFAQV